MCKRWDTPANIVTLAVSSSVPASAATQVSRTVNPLLTFNATLDGATITAANIALQGPLGPQAISVSSLGIQLTVSPTTPLLPLGHYTLTVGTGVRGVLGEQLATPVNIDFTVTEAQWSRETHLENASGDAFYANVGVDPSGNAMAIWSQSNGQRYNVLVSRYRVGSGWGAPEIIEHNDVGDSSTPQISVAPDGTAVAVWRQSDVPGNASPRRDTLWANRYVPGQGWSVAERIDSMSHTELPKVAVDSNGNAMAIWYQIETGGNRNIWANRYTAGIGWGTARLLENAPGLAQFPAVTMSPDGSAFAIWARSNGTTGFDLLASKFE